MPPQKVAGFTSEYMAALRRNGWPASVGMPGRNPPEYAYFSRYMAILFYEHIRCGIFHHGIILGDSKICAGRDVPLANLTESDSGLIINHVFFHWQLAEEFNEYLVRLKDPGEIELRENFERKMDYICGII